MSADRPVLNGNTLYALRPAGHKWRRTIVKINTDGSGYGIIRSRQTASPKRLLIAIHFMARRSPRVAETEAFQNEYRRQRLH